MCIKCLKKVKNKKEKMIAGILSSINGQCSYRLMKYTHFLPRNLRNFGLALVGRIHVDYVQGPKDI